MMTEIRTGSDVVFAARHEGDAVVAAVRGEIDLHRSPELRTQVLDLLARYAPKKLVLNLTQVKYTDSSAIAVLVEAVQKLRKSGGVLALVGLQPRVRSLMEIARLDSIFAIAVSEEEALAR